MVDIQKDFHLQCDWLNLAKVKTKKIFFFNVISFLKSSLNRLWRIYVKLTKKKNNDHLTSYYMFFFSHLLLFWYRLGLFRSFFSLSSARENSHQIELFRAYFEIVHFIFFLFLLILWFRSLFFYNFLFIVQYHNVAVDDVCVCLYCVSAFRSYVFANIYMFVNTRN